MGESAAPEISGGFESPESLLKDGGPSGGASTADGGFPLPSFNKGKGAAGGGGGAATGGGGSAAIDLLKDVDLDVKIELGRTKMLVEDVLKLGEGSVVELDKLAGDPVDVFVNDQLVARGEVLVLNDNFCVRINEIVTVVEEQA